MKIRKYFILVGTALILAAGLLAQATMPNAQDQSRIRIEEAFPRGKITDRRAFFVGALFAQAQIVAMQNEALDAPRDRKHILNGLKGVRVIVEDVNSEAEKYGLTQQLLQTDTELRLRQHGIRIFTLEDVANDTVEQDNKRFEILSQKYRSLEDSFDQKDSDEHFLQYLQEFIQLKTSPLPPILYINVTSTVSEESGRAAFLHEVELQEGAHLSRTGGFCHAAIWEEGGVAGCSLSRFKEYVRECLRDNVDEFINDYLAANPKDRSSEEEQ